MRLQIELLENWTQQNSPDGPVTFCRECSTSAFQVSWAVYRGDKQLPKMMPDSLKQMAIEFGRKTSFGEMVESSCGDCKFGTFGTAVFRSVQHPRIQVWFISDGRDQIMATHVCDQAPESSEVDEVQQIATSLALSPEQPEKQKWKFW